jgi:hypothetical protein
VAGHLDDHWSDWLGGHLLVRDDDSTTEVVLESVDQTELHGVLSSIRDLGVRLLTLREASPGCQGSCSDYVDAMDFDEAAAAEFLARPHVGIFSVASPSGPPAAVPVWYSYAVGGHVWMITEAASRKRRLLARTGCATLVVDEVAPRTRYVSVDCHLVGARPATAEDQQELAARYVPADALEAYLATVAENLPNEQRLTLQPTHWRFADLTS